MRQQVNLLDPELLPKREPFHSSLILLLPVVTLLALFAYYGYARWELTKVRGDFTQLAQQEEQLISELTETVTKHPRKERDPMLDQRIKELGEEKVLKLRVLETLKGRTLSNTEGFANHLAAISDQWLEGVWLKRVVVDGAGGNLRLTGYTTTAALPPQLVENLGKLEPLSGTGYRTFRITRAKNRAGVLHFELDTRRVDPTPEEEAANELANTQGLMDMPGMDAMGDLPMGELASLMAREKAAGR